MGMNILRCAFGIRIDRVRNDIVRNLCGVENNSKERAENSVLKCYGHVVKWMGQG